LTDAIYRKHKECNGIKRIVQLHSQECNGTYSIALLGNGIFYSISRDHKQTIKRSEFNKVLYNHIIVWYYKVSKVLYNHTIVWYGIAWYGMVN
jgi:ribosomal protein L33